MFVTNAVDVNRYVKLKSFSFTLRIGFYLGYVKTFISVLMDNDAFQK